jgi:pSer/pThr/pTyr-binding forkhead associated (FHA) protein
MENDGSFDVGCQVLEQEDIDGLLPYKIKHLGKRKQIIYSVEGDNIIKLDELMPNMDENDIIDVVYELFYLIAKVEENGLIKRQCLWYKYDNIYYDIKQQVVRIAVMPVIGEAKSPQDGEWYGDFLDTINNIVYYLSNEKSEKIKSLFNMIKNDDINPQDALNEIDKLGGSVSSVLYEKLDIEQLTSLSLVYNAKNKEVIFDVDKDEFVIGRDKANVDGFIPEELSKAVSRRHCLITKVNNNYFVQDLKSSNYTLVNGIMIPPYELMELANNDILSIADLEFRVKIIIS